jgi:hypothetical protein
VHGDGVELGLVLVEPVDRLPRPNHLFGQHLKREIVVNTQIYIFFF